MSSFHLQIVTPDGLFFDGEAESLDVRATTGGVTILPRHINYVTPLGMGVATVKTEGKVRKAACIGGMLDERRLQAHRHHVRVGGGHRSGARTQRPGARAGKAQGQGTPVRCRAPARGGKAPPRTRAHQPRLTRKYEPIPSARRVPGGRIFCVRVK